MGGMSRTEPRRSCLYGRWGGKHPSVIVRSTVSCSRIPLKESLTTKVAVCPAYVIVTTYTTLLQIGLEKNTKTRFILSILFAFLFLTLGLYRFISNTKRSFIRVASAGLIGK